MDPENLGPNCVTDEGGGAFCGETDLDSHIYKRLSTSVRLQLKTLSSLWIVCDASECLTLLLQLELQTHS